MVYGLATCDEPKSRILVAFECFCCCHITLYVNELTKFVGTWFQWDPWFWWRASSLLIEHALTSGTSPKPFPFIYGFFLKGQNSQHVGIDVKPKFICWQGKSLVDYNWVWLSSITSTPCLWIQVMQVAKLLIFFPKVLTHQIYMTYFRKLKKNSIVNGERTIKSRSKNDKRKVQRFVNMVELHEQQLSYVEFVTWQILGIVTGRIFKIGGICTNLGCS